MSLAEQQSVASNNTFFSVESIEGDSKKTVDLSPRFYNSNSSKLFSHGNKSLSSVSAATSIFERDVENDSVFTMSSSSVNMIPMRLKSENYIAPALNASVEALRSKDYKSIEIISSKNKTSDALANCLSPSRRPGSSSISNFGSPRSYRNSPCRVNSLPARKTNISVEDLVRKNSTVSFCSYSDYLEEESQADEAHEPITPHNIFGESRKGSISKVLNGSLTNLSSALGAPSVIKRNKSVKSNFYTHTNSSNISVIEELKFKSMMTRKMSNLDDAMDLKPQKDSTPIIPDSPTASPVALALGEPCSVISSPLEDIEDQEMIDFEDPLEEFETVLDNAFSYSYSTGSNLNICSLDQTIKKAQLELS